jgi:hypothetical protein
MVSVLPFRVWVSEGRRDLCSEDGIGRG